MAAIAQQYVLSINAGSSSVKFALYRLASKLECVFDGAVDAIGEAHSRFHVRDEAGASFERRFAIPEAVSAVHVLVEWLVGRLSPESVAAIVHRVVGASSACAAQPIDKALLASLYEAMRCDPGHLPQEIRLIESLQRHFPDSAHIACSDSAFHTSMPSVAWRLPIPRAYDALGIRKMGFHGLSCAYLMHALGEVAGASAAAGKVVIAHLGGGASVTALENGSSRDTSMGLSPAGGIMMGKRSGDVDPALAWHLSRTAKLGLGEFHQMVNHHSGLLGVSGRSADIRTLLQHEGDDPHAAEALAMFCYQARKSICAMAGAVDGLDTLIFSGGIGERSDLIRSRICAGLHHLGLEIDTLRNANHAALISSDTSAVRVRVIGTDEQWMMAEYVRQLLARSVPLEVEALCHD